MSFFDQPYYALTKTLMSRIGIWPEQSKYVRIIRALMMFTMALTLFVPWVIRFYDTWRDLDMLARSLTILIMGVGIFTILFSCIHHMDKMKLSLKIIEKHWEIFKNTPGVIVLDKYAEQGRYITVVYSTCIYIAMILFYVLCLSPIILDFVDPMNKSRSKVYIVEAEYGLDADKYYWLIIGHTYIVATTSLSIMIAVQSMYILWTVHVCALFEIVGFYLKLIDHEYTVNKDTAITLRSDWHHKKICDCVVLHTQAISFAGLMEDGCSGTLAVALGSIASVTVISGVQALLNFKRPEVLLQQVTLIIGQVLHLYIISIPGQELINRSGKIHTAAYNLNWQDMSVNAQKLLILILMRTGKPCYFTAGKVYVLSMETFGSAIRTVISYFTIFAQMI